VLGSVAIGLSLGPASVLSTALWVLLLLYCLPGIALLNLGLWQLLYHRNYWTPFYYCNTVSDVASVLSTEKQTATIAALAEGSSIRSIERITGVHRDAIMR
jgi:hypothetical protein